ncbi:glycoside hydrolase family 43 protein [Amniculicola lignicola CBS 123094]|uniref:Glycoside hydrolase family 43 protein n=1 Tax=Amniculicola lignicola CBS 123094 TaxID=1392246 RepID=A0A6A5WQZ5_9PLEO|nr:glycoside hydrolase family 43 protein [Amniculicola lignicola CBS 123094]
MSQLINPIIPGFAPDPSLVLVGGTYFLVNSSFHMFPGLPIFASRDLVNWNQIGNAIHKQSQLSLGLSDTKLVPLSGQKTGETLLATGGLYAPTIRYYGGVFYIVCTNVVHRNRLGSDTTENFIISTGDIWANDWSDPVYFDFKGIDPSLFRDDDGKVYLHGSGGTGPGTTINLFEIDLVTGKKLSEEKTIWKGTGGIYPEGPHMYKKDNFYYLLISEGGTHEGHMITMARSTAIWGPYESCPANPILTARDTDEYIQYTGHCEAFQDVHGKWWGVCLGARKDSTGRAVMGRETFLTGGKWDEGGWLVLDRVKLDVQGKIPSSGSGANTAVPMVDYIYIRDARLDNYDYVSEKGSISILASSTDLDSPTDSPSFVGKRQRQVVGKSSVIVFLAGVDQSLRIQAGLACYKDEHRYVRIYIDTSGPAVVTELVNTAQDIHRTSRHDVRLADSVHLSLEYTEQEYRLLFHMGGSDCEKPGCVATVDTLSMTDLDFVGPTIGIFAVSDAKETSIKFGDLVIG